MLCVLVQMSDVLACFLNMSPGKSKEGQIWILKLIVKHILLSACFFFSYFSANFRSTVVLLNQLDPT